MYIYIHIYKFTGGPLWVLSIPSCFHKKYKPFFCLMCIYVEDFVFLSEKALFFK